MPPRPVDTLPGVEPGLAIAGRRHAGTTRGRRCQCCSHRTCSVRQRPLAQAIRACAPRSSSATLTTASPRTQAPGSACPRLGSWTRTTRLAAVGDGCIACLIRESAPRRRRHRLRSASVRHRTAASDGVPTAGPTDSAVPWHDRFHHSPVVAPAMPMPRMRSHRTGRGDDRIRSPRQRTHAARIPSSRTLTASPRTTRSAFRIRRRTDRGEHPKSAAAARTAASAKARPDRAARADL
jgi:hypothetical protein